MEPVRKLHPGIVALIVIVLIGIAATAVIVIKGGADETRTSQVAGDTATVNELPLDSVDQTATYVDGVYSATGSYSSPGGQESIDLMVTIKDGLITDTSLAIDPNNSDARDYQQAFASTYKRLIIGKSINRVSLSRVAGSSLTSNGFNDALDQIKADAKA